MGLFSCFGAPQEPWQPQQTPAAPSTRTRASSQGSEPTRTSRNSSSSSRTGPSVAPSVAEEAELRQASGPGLPAAPKAAPPETSAATLDPLLELSETKYRKLKPLNEGGSGFVHLCMDKYTGEQVAIKYLPRGPHLQGAERELLNLRACAINPHIVKYKEAFLTDNHLAVVTEYADLGDLADYVERVRQKAIPGHGLPIPECRTIFQQLILALDFCHNRGIANRDLKMENLLLSSSADTPLGRSPSVKLCDFGFSKDEKANSMCKTACGTPEYVAPEVLLYNAYNGKSADIWSAGVMLFCMLTGRYPFQEPADAKLPQAEQLQVMFPRIVSARFPRPAWLGLDCLDLLQRMMHVDPLQRLDVQGVLQHPWLREGLPESALEMNRNLMHVSDLLVAGFCTQTEDAIRAICKRALRRGQRHAGRPRVPRSRSSLSSQATAGTAHCSASSVVAGPPQAPGTPEAHPREPLKGSQADPLSHTLPAAQVAEL